MSEVYRQSKRTRKRPKRFQFFGFDESDDDSVDLLDRGTVHANGSTPISTNSAGNPSRADNIRVLDNQVSKEQLGQRFLAAVHTSSGENKIDRCNDMPMQISGGNLQNCMDQSATYASSQQPAAKRKRAPDIKIVSATDKVCGLVVTSVPPNGTFRKDDKGKFRKIYGALKSKVCYGKFEIGSV